MHSVRERLRGKGLVVPRAAATRKQSMLAARVMQMLAEDESLPAQ